VAINGKLVANFSEAIDPATCTAATFTLTQGGTPVLGAVSCVGSHAIFAPTVNLTASTAYAATVTTGFKDLAGNALAANSAWGFTTGTTLDTTAPTMVSTDPINTSTGVPVNKEPNATFSEAIDPATVTTATFFLTKAQSGPGCVFDPFTDPDPCPPSSAHIAGSASTTGTGSVATFVPLITLKRSTTGASGITQTYTATLTTGVKDLAGVALAAPLTWSFAMGAGASAGPYAGAGPAPLALGTAAGYAVLAETGVTNTGPSVITGNVGATTPHTSITGFSETQDPVTGQFATSTQVTGKIFATDYEAPTPGDLATAVSDMGLAYTDAAGRTVPPVVDLGAGNIGGLTLIPGLYKATTGVSIPTGVTLSGGASDVWIFQITGNLSVANGVVVTLSGGAVAKNVFWQVTGQATIGTTATFNGTILSQTSISLGTSAVLNGRALAKTTVTVNQNTVTKP